MKYCTLSVASQKWIYLHVICVSAELASFTWHTVAATVFCCGTVFSSRLQNWDSHTIKAFSYLDELLKHDSESPSNNKAALFFSIYFSFFFLSLRVSLFPRTCTTRTGKRKMAFEERRNGRQLYFFIFCMKGQKYLQTPVHPHKTERI